MLAKLAKPTALAAVVLCGAHAGQADEHPDFSSTTISVGTFVGPAISAAQQAAAATWEKNTGGTVNLVEMPASQLFPKYLTALATGDVSFDVVTIAPTWLPDFSPYLSEMPGDVLGAEAWADIHPVYREIMAWEGKRLGLTIEGEQFALYYRVDLFSDRGEQAAFVSRFGYDLAPPESWDEYNDIAAFFSRPEDSLWGTAEAFFRGDQQAWYLFSHAAGYTNHPANQGAMFFDPTTMAPQLDNPGWVKALEDYIGAAGLSPPGALNFNAADVRAALVAGRVAMAIAKIGPRELAAMVEASTAALGVAPLPGSKRIWDHRTGAWTTFAEPVRSPFLAFGGWLAAVPLASRNKAAAWHYVALLAGAGPSAPHGDAALAPYRLSRLDDLDIWLAVLPEETVRRQYLDTQKANLDAPNIALDMRVPAYEIYVDLLEIEVAKALAGDVPPQQALNQVVEAWEKLTDELGRDAQRAAYRTAMGLPPL